MIIPKKSIGVIVLLFRPCFAVGQIWESWGLY